ncbi:hypothetical protein [Kineothrix sp. MB12-C1]|uniref:hypothetical protein n=1 Tax=Kineothrix sp. MB12-C1 TaxID=3070215 RepID=UPI0027D34D97|nr:hypothetical protein [Kineothrix sp. MB12-C1]WMC93862.1 hypothetical protein RBB56_06260 [Kineothrix sp. MB12-C1]
MRVFIREQLMNLLKTVQQLHLQLTITEDQEQAIEMLMSCQESAITVGEAVEGMIANIANSGDFVSLLERYCEELFIISESYEGALSKEDVSILEELASKAMKALNEFPVIYHIIFMPYKASMWDSLESIWRACKEDKSCECHVMPLPYYEFDSENTKWEYRYEGDLFPAEVPITHYEEYSLQLNSPDVAYIHNPYDGSNFVTCIHPAFHSDKIKQYIRRLIYVPYYVTTGIITQEHLDLPIYRHMDYMVVQSEYAKSFCRGKAYYDKILPFGSPKLDRVIRLNREESVIPEQWRTLLKGKKVLMLNTSIGCILQEGSIYFNKIRYIYETIRKSKNLVLIWRPHPLLEATLKAMRPGLLEEYRALIEDFLSCENGILDATTDISRTVAIADAYIGEESTSVVNLFGAIGKPVFILNNHITGGYTEEEKRSIHITDTVEQNGVLWVTTNRYNALFHMNMDTKQIHYIERVAGQPKWDAAYPHMVSLGDELILSPFLADDPAVYNRHSQRISMLSRERTKESLRYRQTVVYENRIFYLSGTGDYIAELNMETKEWKYHLKCIQEIRKVSGIHEIVFCDYAAYGRELWISLQSTNYLLKFHMDDGTYKCCAIENAEYSYSGISVDDTFLWLAEVQNGNIVRWNKQTFEARVYSMPETFRSWNELARTPLTHLRLLDMGEWIVTIPGFSNGMVKLSKSTGEISMLAKEFWERAEEPANGYTPGFHLSSEFGSKIGSDNIFVQRNCDDVTAILHVEKETYEMFKPALTEADLIKLMEGERGFERISRGRGFFKRESKLFSLEDFFDDLILGRLEDIKKIQIEELSDLAANLDGTCGDKVHEYVMHILEENR